MNKQEKIEYFNTHIEELFDNRNQSLTSFISECLNYTEAKEILIEWPSDIKIRVVERYFKEFKLNNLEG